MTVGEQKNMFQPFYRGNSSTPGHGIGMALVERIARMHGFLIEVHTKEGHGTTFVLYL